LACDHYFSRFKTRNSKHVPRLSDVVDREHLTAMPYTDVFLTKDGYLQSFLEYLQKHVPWSGAKIFPDLTVYASTLS
jgi:hypothetical protein